MRFCTQCELNVYNLSGMRRAEAERLVARAEGRLCVRFFRRADGTIITKDCPVGLRALKRRVTRGARAAAAAVLTFVAGLATFFGFNFKPSALTSVREAVTGSGLNMPVRPPAVAGQMVVTPPREEMGTPGPTSYITEDLTETLGRRVMPSPHAEGPGQGPRTKY